MIKLTQSEQFLRDLESALEWVHLSATQDGKDPEELKESFKRDFINVINLIQANPFMYSSYGSSNPTRRAILFHGIYVAEYQLIPVKTKSKESVEEIILTSLIATRSGRYQGAYEELRYFKIDFDDD